MHTKYTNYMKGQSMNFFSGRYGNDQFGWFLFIASLIIEVIGMIVTRVTGVITFRFIYWIGVALFIYMVARIFSRNIPKRAAENEKYLAIRNRILNRRYFRQQRRNGTYTYNEKERSQNGRGGVVYCYFYCPSCKQQVRIPAGKGHVKVTCPKCREKFDAHT